MASEPTVLHLFCGMGGGALGFQRAGFRSIGNLDVDPVAVQDVEYLTGEKATQADLSTLTPQELREICGERRPDVLFTSPPCKGFSGCLAGERVGNEHYSGLNDLSLRGVWIALEAWDEVPPLILFENVPRIAARGKQYIERVEALLRSYGYAVHRSTHNCAVLGGLGQNRERFLLVARHMETVPEYLRVPQDQAVRTAGEVLSQLPVPGTSDAGPMHRLPRQSPLNWSRLAAIPAGRDWRELPSEIALSERKGRQNGGFGVNAWDAPTHTVVAEGSVRNTWASIADPRVETTGNHPVAQDDRPCHQAPETSDGSWHRPMTSLELAVLQGFPARVRGEWLKLTGNSHKAWRGRIGNAVPPPTAEAIARCCAATLAATSEDQLQLNGAPVWVAPREEARPCL